MPAAPESNETKTECVLRRTANATVVPVAHCNATACPDAGCALYSVPIGSQHHTDQLLQWYIYIFLAFGAVMYAKAFAQYTGAEAVTFHIRDTFYTAFLQRSMGWHDRHGTGELTESLARDAAQARKLHYDFWPPLVQSLTLLGGGIGVGLYLAWQFTLLVVVALPFVVVALAFDAKFMVGANAEMEDPAALEETSHADMIMRNLQIIVSQGRGSDYLRAYQEKARVTQQTVRGNMYKLALAFFTSQVVLMSFIGFISYWAMYNVVYLDGQPEDLICTIIPLINSVSQCSLALQWYVCRATCVGARCGRPSPFRAHAQLGGCVDPLRSLAVA